MAQATLNVVLAEEANLMELQSSVRALNMWGLPPQTCEEKEIHVELVVCDENIKPARPSKASDAGKQAKSGKGGGRSKKTTKRGRPAKNSTVHGVDRKNLLAPKQNLAGIASNWPSKKTAVLSELQALHSHAGGVPQESQEPAVGKSCKVRNTKRPSGVEGYNPVDVTLEVTAQWKSGEDVGSASSTRSPNSSTSQSSLQFTCPVAASTPISKGRPNLLASRDPAEVDLNKVSVTNKAVGNCLSEFVDSQLCDNTDLFSMPSMHIAQSSASSPNMVGLTSKSLSFPLLKDSEITSPIAVATPNFQLHCKKEEPNQTVTEFATASQITSSSAATHPDFGILSSRERPFDSGLGSSMGSSVQALSVMESMESDFAATCSSVANSEDSNHMQQEYLVDGPSQGSVDYVTNSQEADSELNTSLTGMVWLNNFTLDKNQSPSHHPTPNGRVRVASGSEHRQNKGSCDCERSHAVGEEDKQKPPHTYKDLIEMALLSAENRMMTTREIQTWLIDKFEYFKIHEDCKSWRNGIRHNLSYCRCFVKDSAKKRYWTLNTSVTAKPPEQSRVEMVPSSVLEPVVLGPTGVQATVVSEPVILASVSQPVVLNSEVPIASYVPASYAPSTRRTGRQAYQSIRPRPILPKNISVLDSLPSNVLQVLKPSLVSHISTTSPAENRITTVTVPAQVPTSVASTITSAGVIQPAVKLMEKQLKRKPVGRAKSEGNVGETDSTNKTKRKRTKSTSSNKSGVCEVIEDQVLGCAGLKEVSHLPKNCDNRPASSTTVNADVGSVIYSDKNSLKRASSTPPNSAIWFKGSPLSTFMDLPSVQMQISGQGIHSREFQRASQQKLTCGNEKQNIKIPNLKNERASDVVDSKVRSENVFQTGNSPPKPSADLLLSPVSPERSNPALSQKLMESPVSGSSLSLDTSTPVGKLKISMEPIASPIHEDLQTHQHNPSNNTLLCQDLSLLFPQDPVTQTLSEDAKADKYDSDFPDSRGQTDNDQSGLMTPPPACLKNSHYWSGKSFDETPLGFDLEDHQFSVPDLPEELTMMETYLEEKKTESQSRNTLLGNGKDFSLGEPSTYIGSQQAGYVMKDDSLQGRVAKQFSTVPEEACPVPQQTSYMMKDTQNRLGKQTSMVPESVYSVCATSSGKAFEGDQGVKVNHHNSMVHEMHHTSSSTRPSPFTYYHSGAMSGSIQTQPANSNIQYFSDKKSIGRYSQHNSLLPQFKDMNACVVSAQHQECDEQTILTQPYWDKQGIHKTRSDYPQQMQPSQSIHSAVSSHQPCVLCQSGQKEQCRQCVQHHIPHTGFSEQASLGIPARYLVPDQYSHHQNVSMPHHGEHHSVMALQNKGTDHPNRFMSPQCDQGLWDQPKQLAAASFQGGFSHQVNAIPSSLATPLPQDVEGVLTRYSYPIQQELYSDVQMTRTSQAQQNQGRSYFPQQRTQTLQAAEQLQVYPGFSSSAAASSGLSRSVVHNTPWTQNMSASLAGPASLNPAQHGSSNSYLSQQSQFLPVQQSSASSGFPASLPASFPSPSQFVAHQQPDFFG